MWVGLTKALKLDSGTVLNMQVIKINELLQRGRFPFMYVNLVLSKLQLRKAYNNSALLITIKFS